LFLLFVFVTVDVTVLGITGVKNYYIFGWAVFAVHISLTVWLKFCGNSAPMCTRSVSRFCMQLFFCAECLLFAFHMICNLEDRLEIFVSIFVIDNLLLQYVICIQTGLGVLPDERNISVPVMVWRSCAYTIMTVGL